MNAVGGAKSWRERIRKVLLAARIAIVLGFCWFLIVSNSPAFGDFFAPERLGGRIRVSSDCAGEESKTESLRVRYAGWPTSGPCVSQDDTWPKRAPREDTCMYELDGGEGLGLPRCIVEAGLLEHVDEPSCSPFTGIRRSEEYCWLHKGAVDDREVECKGQRVEEGVVLTCKAGGRKGSMCKATLEWVALQWPGGLFGVSCVATAGAKIYCFGGQGTDYSSLDSIVEFDPTNWAATVKSAVLPSGRTFPSCAPSDNGNIYCLGGEKDDEFLTEIIEYDPRSDKVAVMSEKLPNLRSLGSCVASREGTIRCFGRSAGEKPSAVLIEYVPGAHRIGVVPVKLAEGGATDCVLAANGKVYCAGAMERTTEAGDRIWETAFFEYDPSAIQLIKRTAGIPLTRGMSCVAGTDARIFCFGYREMSMFDPSTGAASLLDIQPLIDLETPSCVASGDSAYCFGQGEENRRVEGVFEFSWSMLNSAKPRE